MTIQSVPMQLVTASDRRSADLYMMGDIRRASFWDSFDESGSMAESKTDSLDVTHALMELPETVSEICVHINSFGGEVAEGLAIYNALKAHSARVTTVCEGFACSIASVIFMAGEERVMRESSLLMIHNPSLRAGGTADDLRRAADALDSIREASVSAYMAHATVERDEITSLMDAETWIGPEQAVEMGLASSIDKADEEDAPTQSARHAVMDALTCNQLTQLTAETDALSIAQVVVEQLMPYLAPAQQRDEDEDPDPDPDKDDDEGKDDDEPKKAPNQTFQRYARIFRQLAENGD